MSFRIGQTEVVDTFAEAFPMRFTRLVITAATPGRPSGVSPALSERSIAASHLQPITDVAKPVAERAASSAQPSVAAVITSRA